VSWTWQKRPDALSQQRTAPRAPGSTREARPSACQLASACRGSTAGAESLESRWKPGRPGPAHARSGLGAGWRRGLAQGGAAGSGTRTACAGLVPSRASCCGLRMNKKHRQNLSEVDVNNEIHFYTLLVCSFVMKLNFL